MKKLHSRWCESLAAAGIYAAVAVGAHAAAIAPLAVSSAAFAFGATVPTPYTCSGTDVSPAIRWSGAPARTRSFAVICNDPVARGGLGWVHWVIYDIPASQHSLPAAVPATRVLPGGAVQGINSFDQMGYRGPCPPPGPPHRYVFTVYALDTRLKPTAAATKMDIETAIAGHVLARGELIGTFKR